MASSYSTPVGILLGELLHLCLASIPKNKVNVICKMNNLRKYKNLRLSAVFFMMNLCPIAISGEAAVLTKVITLVMRVK